MKMESLQLSKEQKEKLLLMFDDLFPIYEDIFVDKDDFLCFGDFRIHWFEFCVVHLPLRLSENFNTIDPQEKHRFLIDMMMKRLLKLSSIYENSLINHPVDYLYEQYEKTTEQ